MIEYLIPWPMTDIEAKLIDICESWGDPWKVDRVENVLRHVCYDADMLARWLVIVSEWAERRRKD